MSKPANILAWCEDDQTYDASTDQESEALHMVSESPVWFAWLQSISSFVFYGKTGSYTACKEHKARGEGYWYAYTRIEGKVTKRYLGPGSSVTLARLEQVAQELVLHQHVDVSHEEDVSALRPVSSSFITVTSTIGNVKDGSPSTVRPRAWPLISTKVHAPHPRATVIHRLSLTRRLQDGMERAFTLLSAPAGFGKTTLLSLWLKSSGIRAAWFSVEPEDNDPIRFFSYLIAALQVLDPQLGATFLPLLQSRQPIPLETALALLINDLSTRKGSRFVLVLDDYHVITAESIHQALTHLVEHLPAQMHLIIATRTDPPLPLARLRARGQLMEVRADDLRFAAEETDLFLRTVMGVELSSQESALLQCRTEGWIAGLQLAALALREHSNVPAFLAAFTGTHRFVLDYLSEEVLTRQSAPVQAFLFRTCVLDRLCGSLCDAVTGEGNGQVMLERLDALNLFLISLDDERYWYRYHHLFADMLRSHLRQTHSDLIPALHRRASTWYEQNELLIYAVQHAFAASEYEHAARLILQVDPSLVVRGEPLEVYLSWLNALSKDVMDRHPILAIYHAYLLLYLGRLESAEARLQDAEASLSFHTPTDETQTHRGQIVVLRANIALYYGNVERCVELSRQALALLPTVKTFGRAAATAMAVLSYLTDGNVTSTVERLAEEAVEIVQTSGMLSVATRSITNLARLRVLQGRLHRAIASYELVLQEVPETEVLRTIPSGTSYYFGVGDIFCERNDLGTAREYLAQGMALIEGRTTADAPIIAQGYTSLARLFQACGEYRRASAVLEQYASLARERAFMPYLITQGTAVQAHIALAQGDIKAAILWADGCSRSVHDEPHYLYEREDLTLARVYIAQGRANPLGSFLNGALALLERLLHDAQSKARMHSAIEIFMLKALALHAHGDLSAALNTLKHTLTLAEPEGYIRIFLDEGAPMLALLSQVGVAHRGLQEYVQALLAHQNATSADIPASPLDDDRSRQQPLVDPVSERELEVLQLMAVGASNEEIAEHLVIAVGTAKRHVSNILAKLTVTNRTQAVARARELGLL